MIARLLRRLGWSVVVLWGVLTLTFFINFAVPGDPARAIAGPQARPAEVAKIRSQLGLDRSLFTQYTSFLGRLVHLAATDAPGEKRHAPCASIGPVHIDLGVSFQRRKPVLTLLRDRLPATLMLALAAVLVQAILGVITGVIAAVRHRTIVDSLIIAMTMLGVSAPTFLIGIGLQYVLAFRLQWLPFDGSGKTLGEQLQHLVLPALTLGLFGAAYYTRLVRDEMLSQRALDYVRTARAKGASEARVVLVHMLRNVVLPVITVIGLDLGALVGGAIVTEKLFRWPGIGSLSVDAVMERDAPVILGCVLVASVGVVIANLLVDLSFVVLDPRTRR